MVAADDEVDLTTAPSPRWLIGVCLAVLCTPLVIALVAFKRHPWSPVLDLAMTELRVRDVGGSHTPLIGLPGRIGTLAQQGSHPGPISFYALAPTYRALGSSAWALQVATLAIHVVAMGVALIIADRRGGVRLVLAVAAVLAVLSAGFGGGVLTEPWNPYLPLMWWVVVLLAVWSVLCGDLPMLPVAVVAASFCAQTHVPYLGLSLGLGLVAGVAVLVRWWRAPSDRRRARRWAGAAGLIGVILWMPPTVDQARHDPGNYRQLADHFAHPPEAAQGLTKGLSLGLQSFDVGFLAREAMVHPGALVRNNPHSRASTARGAVLAMVWAASAVASVRRRNASLQRLHLVVGTSSALMVLAISKIFGVVWFYLTLWGWAIGTLALVATVWTIIDIGAQVRPANGRTRRPLLSVGVLAIVGLLAAARFTVAAWSSTHADAPVARELAAVVNPVAMGLDRDEGAATGHAGRYLVAWSDAFHIGSQGFGLLNELERRGFHVGVEYGARVPATRHRVLAPAEVTARIVLATGTHIGEWRDMPGAVELVAYDPRSPAQRVEQARLRREVISTLAERGLNGLIPRVDDNLFGAAIDFRVPSATRDLMGRMLDIGAPLAVFVLPPQGSPG